MGRESLSPLFVANSQELEVEGGGMSHLGAHLSPGTVHGTVGKLNQVQCVLDEGFQLVHRAVGAFIFVLELAGQAAAEDGKGFGPYLFTELEEFEETQPSALVVVRIETVGETVFPAVLVEGAVLHGPHRVLPLVARGQVGPFHYAAPGEAEDAGFKVCQGLGQVFAEAVLVPHPGICGKQGNVLQVHRIAFSGEEDAKDGFIKSAVRRKGEGVFLPFIAGNREFLLAEEMVFSHGSGVHQFYPKLGFSAVRHTGPYGETIGFPFLDAYAEKALIVQAGPFVRVAGVLQANVVGVSFEGTIGLYFHFAEGFPALEGIAGELEGAVFHQLCVQAAIGRVIDVFEEDAVHGALDGRTGLFEADVQGVCLLCLHP